MQLFHLKKEKRFYNEITLSRAGERQSSATLQQIHASDSAKTLNDMELFCSNIQKR